MSLSLQHSSPWWKTSYPIHALTSSRMFPREEVDICVKWALLSFFSWNEHVRSPSPFHFTSKLCLNRRLPFMGDLTVTSVLWLMNLTIWDFRIPKGQFFKVQWTFTATSSPMEPKEYHGPWCPVGSMELDPNQTHSKMEQHHNSHQRQHRRSHLCFCMCVLKCLDVLF